MPFQLDTRIPLGAVQAQQFDPMGSLARAQQMRGMQEQRALIDEQRQIAIDKAQREAAEGAALGELFGAGMPEPEQVYGIVGPERGAKILKGIEDFRGAQLKTADEIRKSMLTRLGAIKSLPTDEIRAEWYAKVIEDYASRGLVDPSKVEPYSMDVLDSFERELMTADQRANADKPIEVSPGVSLAVKNRSGKLETGYTAPEREKVADLGSFQDYLRRQYGPQPTATQIETAKQRYEAAGRAPAGDGSKSWVLRDGKAVRVSEAEIRPGDEPYTNARQNQRKVTSGDAGRISELDTSLDDIGVLRSTLTATAGATGTAAKVGAILPNWATELTGWGEDAKKRQGVIDRVKQVIGKALEGGVLRKEDELKYEKILPTIADTQAVAMAKIEGLEKALRLRRSRHIEALDDAGYDVTDFQARGAGSRQQQQGSDGPPAGTGGMLKLRAPNGEEMDVPSSQAQHYINLGAKVVR